MSKIKVNKDLTTIDNGTYSGIIENAVLCKSGKVMLKIALGDGTFFVSFHDEGKFGRYPFNHLFMAVDSDELDDIKGLHVEFEILNNKSSSTGMTFSNIRRIKVVDKQEVIR